MAHNVAQDARGGQGTAVLAGTLQPGAAAAVRHAAIRSELRALLRAWEGGGLEVLAFKGFHLAEFVYDDPAERPYSDVDLLVREEDAAIASRVARENGWHELWSAFQPDDMHRRRGPRYFGHEVLQLQHARLGFVLDVHRRLVHNNDNRIPQWSRQQRMTELAWSDARRRDWDGIGVWELSPADAILIGLMLSRCWSPDDWRLRPHDYSDFALLVRKHRLSKEQLQERARQLGCSRTLELFLERCDPFEGVNDLSPPTVASLQRWNLRVAPERGNRYLQRSLIAVVSTAKESADIVRLVPEALASLAESYRSGGARRAAAALPPPSSNGKVLTSAEWRSLRRGLHRTLRLLGLGAPNKRDLLAFVMLRSLRRRGCGAVLHWVDTGEGAQPVLELDGARLNMGGTALEPSAQAADLSETGL